MSLEHMRSAEQNLLFGDWHMSNRQSWEMANSSISGLKGSI